MEQLCDDENCGSTEATVGSATRGASEAWDWNSLADLGVGYFWNRLADRPNMTLNLNKLFHLLWCKNSTRSAWWPSRVGNTERFLIYLMSITLLSCFIRSSEGDPAGVQ